MKTIYEQRCRICGCDWNHACNDHDYWFAEDLCSACAERMKPILFNTEMVRAIPDGRKTTTRRVIKPQPEPFGKALAFKSGIYATSKALTREAPYQPSDILYVREKFALDGYEGGKKEYVYWADTDGMVLQWGKGKDEWAPVSDYNWHPSIHMPKAAARIFLRVTDVRAERLQDIAEEQAVTEGAINNHGFIHSPDNEYDTIHTAREHFSQIWNSTVKKSDIDRYGWNANPWVWVITFERIGKLEENADA